MFKPLLSAKITLDSDLEKLKYPLIGSPKIDGIRCICHPEHDVVTRKMLAIPNKHIRESLMALTKYGLDGELIVASLKPRQLFDAPLSGNPACAPDVFNLSQSGVMTIKGIPEFYYIVFDRVRPLDLPYHERLSNVVETVTRETFDHRFLKLADYRYLHTPEEVLAYEVEQLAKGYEGIMLRDPQAGYKFGRSTFKQQILIKVKRFLDDECTVIGYEELQRNTNVQSIDETGHAKRSSHKAGMVAGGTLGKLIVRNDKFGQFSVGSGLNDSIRATVWANQGSYLGKTVNFKYQPVGVKEKPRLPIFKGFRQD